MLDLSQFKLVQSYLAALKRRECPTCEQMSAWNAFYRIHDHWIRVVLKKCGAIESDVDDLVQKVWVILLKRLLKFKDDPELGTVEAYVEAVAGHEAGHHRRRRSKHHDTLLTAEVVAAFLDPHASPTAELVCNESFKEVLAVLAELESHLSASSSQILDMRLRENKSVPQIAEASGLSAGSVKMRLRRCLRELRALLRQRGIGPEKNKLEIF